MKRFKTVINIGYLFMAIHINLIILEIIFLLIDTIKPILYLFQYEYNKFPVPVTTSFQHN